MLLIEESLSFSGMTWRYINHHTSGSGLWALNHSSGTSEIIEEINRNVTNLKYL